jgi:hypothetical protein
VLRKGDGLWTAAQEERKRFLKTEVVDTPDTAFAKEVTRLLSACMHACAPAKDTDVEFVHRGELKVEALYVEEDKTLRTHDEWLARDSAIKALKLQPAATTNWKDSDLIVHIVNKLFRTLLEQLPLANFCSRPGFSGFMRPDLHQSARTERVDVECLIAGQSLADYLRLSKAFDFHACRHCGCLFIDRNGRLDPRSGKKHELPEIEVQIHLTSKCGSLRDQAILVHHGTACTSR